MKGDRADVLRIEAMTVRDYQKVSQLWMRTDELGFSSQFDTEEAINAYLLRNPGCSTVATANNQVVGAALCGHDGRRGSIYHVAVQSEFRHQGIASKMIDRCVEQLKRNGIHNGFLFSSNPVSQEFWIKQGWQVLPAITYHYKEF